MTAWWQPGNFQAIDLAEGYPMIALWLPNDSIKEVQIVYRLFSSELLPNTFLLNYAQPASNVGGWMID